MKPVQCPECLSEELVNENFGKVCTNCGNVVNDCPEQVICLNKDDNGQCVGRVSVDCGRVSYKNRHVDTYFRDFTSSLNPRLSSPVKQGIDLIHTLSKNLNLNRSILQQSIAYFKEIVSKEFKMDSNNTKVCLAISCLYAVSWNENNPITLAELSRNTDCPLDHFGTILFRLQKLYPQLYSQKSRNIEQLVPFCLSKVQLEDRERKSISDNTTKLLTMWQDVCLVQGFNPIYVIYAALYFSWKSADAPSRYKISCAEFCTTVHIPYKPIICKRVKFYFQLMQTFHRLSPFNMGEELTLNNIALRLPQMLATKNILLWNYKQANNNSSNKRKNCEDNYDDDRSVMEQIQLAMKEHKVSVDPEDEEISDHEIDSYIRTESEIRRIATVSKQALDAEA